MKKTFKNEIGITLIALVITIIVLLILAGVTIATLTGENGILTRASHANERTREANAREQVQIAVQGSYDESGRINNEDLKTNLEQIENISGVPETIIDEDYPIVVTVEEYSYAINKDGSVGEVIERDGIKIGDYVNYTYDEVAEGYSLPRAESGYTSDQTIAQTSGMKWRVLDIKKDGTVELIGDNSSTDPKIFFRGVLGYNNGVLLLNEMCRELYSNSELGIEARSINIEDIEGQMNEAGIAARNTWNNKVATYGSTKTYGSGYNQYPNLYAEQNGSGINTTETKTNGISESDNGYSSPTEETASTAEEGLTVTQTYYRLSSPSTSFDNSEVYDMIFGTETDYWLASRYSICYSPYATFGLRNVHISPNIGGVSMFDSSGGVWGANACLRPVVSLGSDIQITAVDNADGSSPENMHQISK